MKEEEELEEKKVQAFDDLDGRDRTREDWREGVEVKSQVCEDLLSEQVRGESKVFLSRWRRVF